MRIAIDPGHGGTNLGCDLGAMREKVYTLGFARVLRNTLASHGHEVILTRAIDETLLFTQRAARAKAFNAGLAICIHVNTLEPDPIPRGLRTYYEPGQTRAMQLATNILAETPKELKPFSMRKPEIAEQTGEGPDAVLKRYTMPAVLVEVGFASNANDLKYLLSQTGQEVLCDSIARAVNNWGTK